MDAYLKAVLYLWACNSFIVIACVLVRFLHVFIQSKHFSTYLADLITYSVIYSTQINGGFPVKTNWLFEGIIFLQYIQHHIFVNSVFKSENKFLMNSSREFCRTTVTRWCYLSRGRRHLTLRCFSCEENSFRRISFFAKWSWLAPFLGIGQKPRYRWLNLKSFSVRPAITSTSAKDLSNEKELLCILWVSVYWPSKVKVNTLPKPLESLGNILWW